MSRDLQNRLVEIFVREVQDRTRKLERDLLALESAPAAREREALIGSLLQGAHSLKGAAGLVPMKPLEMICHRMEDLFTAFLDGRATLDGHTIQILLRANDLIAEMGQHLERGEPPDTQIVEDLCLELVTIAPPDRGATGSFAIRDSDPATRSRKVEMPAETDRRAPGSEEDESWVRVSASKLDGLLKQSGELLIARSRGRLYIEQLSRLQEQLRRAKGRLDRTKSGAVTRQGPPSSYDDMLNQIGKKLQEFSVTLATDRRMLDLAASSLDAEVRRARLQLFSTACVGLDRLVRDLATSSEKEADLDIIGGEIELDRAIAEALGDVFRHLVRNAMDHGIETVAERRAAGKPERGRISVQASLKGDRVALSVTDDGRGLDIGKIEEAAGARADLADGDPVQQIFLPGVSTSETVTTISGRGIGLDIVKTSIERMRGVIDVSTEPGLGTTFSISLPLTLGTIRALLVRAGEQVLAIDTSSVDRVVRVTSDQMVMAEDRLHVLMDARPAPAIDLRDWFGLPLTGAEKTASSFRPAVLLNEIGRGAAVLVDNIVAEQECIVRTAGPRLQKVRDYSGGSILPDGTVALVLNAARLGHAAYSRRPSRESAATPDTPAAKRILIAEDSLTVRTLTKTILEGAGYEVEAAADGKQAWQLIQRGATDLVLADVDMPGMDGFELTEKLRQSAHFRNIPVILLTARENDADKQRGLEAGADAYLVKSTFDQRELLKSIGHLV